MKNLLMIVIAFALISLSTKAQLTFQKTYGGSIGTGDHPMQITSDGGYIISGGTTGLGLIKTDQFGDTLWTKTFTDSSMGNGATSIQQTADMGYILTGWGYPGGPPAEYIIKTDSLGVVIWIKGNDRKSTRLNSSHLG